MTMNRQWKGWLDRVLQEGEMFGLVFVALMLIVIEGCLVYWLHHLQFPERPVSPLGFLVMPPWYQKPRFEVTLLLTIAAGTLFSACRGLCHAWRERDRDASVEVIKSLRRRLTTAASVAALAGFNLAIATWLR
jgi:hypothetical protein